MGLPEPSLPIEWSALFEERPLGVGRSPDYWWVDLWCCIVETLYNGSYLRPEAEFLKEFVRKINTEVIHELTHAIGGQTHPGICGALWSSFIQCWVVTE